MLRRVFHSSLSSAWGSWNRSWLLARRCRQRRADCSEAFIRSQRHAPMDARLGRDCSLMDFSCNYRETLCFLLRTDAVHLPHGKPSFSFSLSLFLWFFFFFSFFCWKEINSIVDDFLLFCCAIEQINAVGLTIFIIFSIRSIRDCAGSDISRLNFKWDSVVVSTGCSFNKIIGFRAIIIIGNWNAFPQL